MERLSWNGEFVLQQDEITKEFTHRKTPTELYDLIVSTFPADKLLLRETAIRRISVTDFDQAVEQGLLLPMETSERQYYYYDSRCWLPCHHSLTIEQGTVSNQINEDGYPTEWDNIQVKIPKFSYYRKPVKNTIPYQDISPFQLYQVITGNWFIHPTAHVKTLGSLAEKRKYKAKAFDYCTPGCTGTQRGEEYVKDRSGLIVIDLDHIDEPEALRDTLIGDENLTTVLAFISPSGHGLKWIVQLDLAYNHLKNFLAIANYLQQRYGLKADPSGKDIARACFVSHDPSCYLNPDFAQ